MKGAFSMMAYLIAFLLMGAYFRSAAVSIIGTLNGKTLELVAVSEQIVKAIPLGKTTSVPEGIEVFASNCPAPLNENLDQEDINAAVEACEGSEGVICAFMDYLGARLRSCKGTRFRLSHQFYHDGGEAAVIRAELDESTLTATLQKL